MFSTIQPHQYVAIRLPSDNIKVEQILPNSVINLGKYGSFHTNQVIGRPFHLTFEILDGSEPKDGRELRVVPATELHAETLLEELEPEIGEDESTSTPNATQFDEYGLPTTAEKSNVNIHDNPTNQRLTMEEIEALKSDQMANPRELISKIMASHSQLDQKTAFSLAKYTLRKQKKYIKRFTILPLDVAMLTDWMMNEKDFGKIMEIRNEILGLMGSWANVHASEPVAEGEESRCRYLMVDDTGGLVVTAMAERMGILHHNLEVEEVESETATLPQDLPESDDILSVNNEATDQLETFRRRQIYTHDLATSNTINLVHANQQPNLSLLRYFNYDPTLPISPYESNPHPLQTRLKILTWLQLLDPASDPTYQEPAYKSPEELQSLKSNHRSTYHRKRRRWERCSAIVNETRAGGFNGLLVASYTNPVSILKHLVPLLAGGAQIVVYYPHVEPLMELADVYSTARRTAYLHLLQQHQQDHEHRQQQTEEDVDADDTSLDLTDFPVDPTLTLGFMLQTARVRRWQVLPGRTHPLMMGRGGAEGYVAVGTRVLPVTGRQVVARGRAKHGKMPKKRPEAHVSAQEEQKDNNMEVGNTASEEEHEPIVEDDGEGHGKRMKIEQDERS